jgi:hypothetical protein
MAEFTPKPISGTFTATGTASVLSSSEKQLKQGIWIQVRTGDAVVEVIANDGSTVGINVAVGTDRFFPCDSFNDLLVKGSDSVYYWAF